MNIANQRLMTHSTLLYVLLFGVSLFLATGWLPPPSPLLTPEEVASELSKGGFLRPALQCAAFFSPLYMGITGAISVQLRRIEGEHSILAGLQFSMGVLGCVSLVLPCLIWLVISYRPEQISDLVQVVFNDFAWFVMLGSTGPLFFQLLALALCIITAKNVERTNRIYPRWVAFFTMFVAFGGLVGLLIPFFKAGPFAWDGLFGFWVVATVFFAWVLVIYTMTLKAIKNQELCGQ